jgi:hypothetical protein
MKKIIYLFPVFLLLAGIYVYINSNEEMDFDKKITFRKNDTRPYGTKVLYSCLKQLYKNKKFVVNTKSPNYWCYEDSVKHGDNVLFIHTKQFEPTYDELQLLESFIYQGNTVFISSTNFNKEAANFFDISTNENFYDLFGTNNYPDSVNVYLKKPLFNADTTYLNYGFTSNTKFITYDTFKTVIAGENHNQNPNFIALKIGEGKLYLHSDPFLFTNYFVLKEGNSDYLKKCLALLPKSSNKLIWDEYYFTPQKAEQKNQSPLRVLFSYPAFKWSFWLLILLGILYSLINIKRKQRYIKHIPPPANDSIEFAKTVGRLYYEQKDHLNLAQKMVTYFLEHIRNKYLLNTNNLDETFVTKLSGKSGYDENKIEELIRTIEIIKNNNTINEAELNKIYLQFQQFYNHTTT